MKLRSEGTEALHDIRKQPCIKLEAFVCMCSSSNPKLSSWRKSRFRSLRLGEHKTHKVCRGPCVEQGVKAGLCVQVEGWSFV